MSEYVTDTHPLLWHILSSARLSATAQAVFADADAGLHRILIPSIVLVEAIYLAEKKRIDPAALDRLFSLLDLAPANYAVVPLDAEIVRTVRTVDRVKVPEMPDRIIVATAKHLRLEVVTRDNTIAASGIVTILW
jgi:PIN domain nuclease of toxin-antitoxin system